MFTCAISYYAQTFRLNFISASTGSTQYACIPSRTVWVGTLTFHKKKFTDAVNGKSGLTYWDALESEVDHDTIAVASPSMLTPSQTKSSATIETLFPEVLRDPILRNVQFSTITRMDELGKPLSPLPAQPC